MTTISFELSCEAVPETLDLEKEVQDLPVTLLDDLLQLTEHDITDMIEDKRSYDTVLVTLGSIDNNNSDTYSGNAGNTNSNTVGLIFLYLPQVKISVTDDIIISVFKLNGFMQFSDSYFCCVCDNEIKAVDLTSHYTQFHLPLRLKDICHYCFVRNDKNNSLELHLGSHRIEFIKRCKVNDNSIELPQFIKCNETDFYLYHMCNISEEDRTLIKKVFYKLYKTAYECMDCNLTFLKKSALDAHKCKQHIPKGIYVCGKCKYLFTDRVLFYDHIKRCFKCCFLCQELGCERTPDSSIDGMPSDSHSLNEIRDENNNNVCNVSLDDEQKSSHYCSICFMHFKNNYLLKKHRKNHKIHRNAIRTVVKTVDEKTEKSSCPRLSERTKNEIKFESKTGKIVSVDNKSVGNDFFPRCSICNLQFVSRFYYRKHRLEEHRRQNELCVQQNYERNTSHIVENRNADNNSNTSHIVENCNADNISNTSHIVENHNADNNSNTSHIAENRNADNNSNTIKHDINSEKNISMNEECCTNNIENNSKNLSQYFCPFCNMEFSLKFKYLNHMRYTHKIVHYACNICDKTFQAITDLNRHCKKYKHYSGLVSYEGLQQITKIEDKENIPMSGDDCRTIQEYASCSERYTASRPLDICEFCCMYFYGENSFNKHKNCSSADNRNDRIDISSTKQFIYNELK